jgi:transcriptional regulator with XRE-family HTH domain
MEACRLSEPINRSFGQRVRQLRLAKSWMLPDLADRVGCTPQQLSQLERGNPELVSPTLLDQLALHLEADVDELYVLAGRLPPCLAWVQSDPGVVKVLGAMVALVDRRIALSHRPMARAEH